MPLSNTNASYFQSFADYLQNGQSQSLNNVFPGVEDLAVAAVYRNGYLRNCVDALRANFSTVHTLIGDEYFTRLALKYVANFPPQKGTLVGYGQTFPAFIERNLGEHQLSYLSSFAQLDLAWLSAYFAATENSLNAEFVQHWLETGNDIPSLRVTLVGSASIHSLEFEISALWSTLKEQDEFEQSVQAPQNPETVLIWRDSDNLITMKALNAAELLFIAPFAGQASSVGFAAQSAMAFDARFNVSDYFSELLASNLLTSPPE